jgi:DNA repair protein SbcD/Mre11
MLKFIHSADIHLDSPLRGLERYDGAPVQRIRGATRQALINLVDLSISEEVDFVLIAGDLYDGDWKDYNTGLFFAAQMSRLREAGIKVFMISGNHDAASHISRQLRMPENVVKLSSKKPQTVILDPLGVAIHGQGFLKTVVTDDLSEAYPGAIAGLFNIGLLHTSATGREGHEPYAPCSVEGLAAKGYDYWALGHVHKREVLCKEPMIVFAGNIQGRHIRESGPKGCTLVCVEDGRIVSAEHRELDVLRWCLKRVDVTGRESANEVVDLVGSAIKEEMEQSDGYLLAMRLHIAGPCRAHGDLVTKSDRWINEIRMSATDVSGGNVWIEKVRMETEIQMDLEEMMDRDDPIGGLLRSVRQLGASDEVLAELLPEFADLKRKLPSDLHQGDEPLEVLDPRRRGELVEEVKRILVGRLLDATKPQ